ncbi:MAG: type II secretion system protein [Pseudomonadota bacterium]
MKTNFHRTGNTQSGFTIVELVVVIILLGILAATALPRFVDLDDEANAAAFEGVVGGLQTGVALYHAQWLANNKPAASTQIAEFGNLRTNTNGYPVATDNVSVITDDGDCAAIFSNLLQGGPSVGTGSGTGSTSEFTADRQSDTACDYYYTEQSSQAGQTIPRARYNASTGIITSDTYTLP